MTITREQVIEIASIAGFGQFLPGEPGLPATWYGFDLGSIEKFAELIAAAEREECANICDTTPPYPFRPSIEAAHAIRARGSK